MDERAKLELFITEGRSWVQSQRDHHRPTARTLFAAEKVELAPFFQPHILEAARVKKVPRIENPGFYQQLEAWGQPIPLDFTTMQGITFVDTILISEAECSPETPLYSLLFHELVHMVQYSLLGKDQFVEQYVRGWDQAGRDYERIPLEQDAKALEELYQKQPKENFSVEAEVRRRLGLR